MSLSIDTTATSQLAQQGSSSQSNWQNVLSAAAGVLGMSTGAVSAQLRAGASLASIAQSGGVPQQALAQAISGALSPSTRSATTSAQRQQIATSIADRLGGAGSRRGPGADQAGDPLLASAGSSSGSGSSSRVDLLAITLEPDDASGASVDELA
jgi:hypothetical protein